MPLAREGFLILPDEVTSYQADQSEPWTHIWVGFHGSRAGEYLHQCGLGRDHRVYRCAAPDRLDHCVREMMRYEIAGRGHELMLQGELYHFLGWIARSAEEPPTGGGRPARSMWSWPWSTSATTFRRI